MVSQVLQAQVQPMRFHQPAPETVCALGLACAAKDCLRGKRIRQQCEEKPIGRRRWRRHARQARLGRYGLFLDAHGMRALGSAPMWASMPADRSVAAGASVMVEVALAVGESMDDHESP
ncbi:MAG: hypothetical protein ACREVI_11160 [Steroidobacteraceae bacterium]